VPVKRVVTIAAAIGVLALVVTACIPDQATGAWQLYGGSQKSNVSGANLPVLVLGDSLVYLSGPDDSAGNPTDGVQTYADNVRFFSGRNSTVVAAAGASWSHFTKSSLIGSAGLSTAYDYIKILSPRLTVVALGTNDARILSVDSSYTFDDFIGSVNSIRSAALEKSRCVLLINVTERPATGAPFVEKAKLVNLGLLTQTFDRPYVKLADWNTYSAGAVHDSWFKTDGLNFHHTDLGKGEYRKFIMSNIASTLADPLCT
jgi:hypothetical protein